MITKIDIAESLAEYLENRDGFSFKVDTGEFLLPEENRRYVVSPYRSRERVIDRAKFCATDLAQYIGDNSAMLGLPNHYLGAWTNGGNIYLDISVTRADLGQALQLARIANQACIWDMVEGQSIFLSDCPVGWDKV